VEIKTRGHYICARVGALPLATVRDGKAERPCTKTNRATKGFEIRLRLCAANIKISAEKTWYWPRQRSYSSADNRV